MTLYLRLKTALVWTHTTKRTKKICETETFLKSLPCITEIGMYRRLLFYAYIHTISIHIYYLYDGAVGIYKRIEVGPHIFTMYPCFTCLSVYIIKIIVQRASKVLSEIHVPAKL